MTLRSALLVSPFTCFVLATLAACANDGGTAGALAQTSARADCAPGDTACQIDGLDAPLAVGARVPVDVRVTARGVAAPKLVHQSARSDVLLTEGNELVGASPGWSSVLFVTDDGIVLDFITLRVANPERLELYRLDTNGSVEPTPLPGRIQLAPGDDLELSVKAFAGATRLIGDLAVQWSIEGATPEGRPVAVMLDAGRRASRRIRVKEPGSSIVHVVAGTFDKVISLEVLP